MRTALRHTPTSDCPARPDPSPPDAPGFGRVTWTSPPARPVLYILDSYSLIYQVFHAIPTMTGPSGQPTNAVFGIFRDLLNLIRKAKPDYLAAAFEGGEPAKRLAILPEYKANRAAMPDDLQGPQIEVIKRLVRAFNVPVLIAHEGAEADDVIATLAKKAEAHGLDVVICTADKDARQLLSDHVRILNLRKGEFLDPAGLLAEWKVRPDQVVDLLSLTGDAVDNVPAIPGIGSEDRVESARGSRDVRRHPRRTSTRSRAPSGNRT